MSEYDSYACFWSRIEELRKKERMSKAEFESYIGVSKGFLSRVQKETDITKYGYLLDKLNNRYKIFSSNIMADGDHRKLEFNGRVRRFLAEIISETKEGITYWTPEKNFVSDMGCYDWAYPVVLRLEQEKQKIAEMWSVMENRTSNYLFFVLSEEKLYYLLLCVGDNAYIICDGTSNEEYKGLLDELYSVINYYHGGDLDEETETVFRYMGTYLSNKGGFHI